MAARFSSYSEEKERATSAGFPTPTVVCSSLEKVNLDRVAKGHGSAHVLAAFGKSATRVQEKLSKLEDLRQLLSAPLALALPRTGAIPCCAEEGASGGDAEERSAAEERGSPGRQPWRRRRGGTCASAAGA